MSWRTVVIDTPCKVSYKNGYLIAQADEIKRIHLSEIDVVLIANTQVNITGVILCELAKSNIKVVFCDEKFNPYGEIINYYGSHNTSKKVLLQTKWQPYTAKVLWTLIVTAKIQNQARLLKKLNLTQADKLNEYAEEIELADITNREGHAAKVYFKALYGDGFTRNISSKIGNALDYGYTVILSLFNREIVKNGCITQLGINHCNEYNHFNLSSDLIEPFRVIVDEYVFYNQEKVLDKHYKYNLINLLNKKVFLEQEHFLSNAISKYVKSAIDALNTNNLELLKLYQFQ